MPNYERLREIAQRQGAITEEARAELDKVDQAETEAQIREIERQHDRLMREADILALERRQIEAGDTEPERRAHVGPDLAVCADGALRHDDENRLVLHTRDGGEIRSILPGERVSDRHAADDFSVASFVRAEMGFGEQRAVVSGDSNVQTSLGARIIDMVRAQARVLQAGAQTILIDGPTNIARIISDPTFTAHAEGIEDLTESDLVAQAVELSPAAQVALVPLSEEVVADSSNLSAMLNQSLAGALATKLDRAAIDLILADGNVPKNTVARDPATWAGVAGAVGDALAVDQTIPPALIAHVADFTARSSETDGNAAWLGAPPFLSTMRDLPTTAMTADRAVFGDFSRSLAIVTRSELRLEVIRFAKAASYSHLLVAHARIAPVVLQPGRLFVIDGSVV